MPWMSINEFKRQNGIGLPVRLKKRKAEKPASNSSKPKQPFKLLGYDTFSNEWYGLGEFPTEAKARAAGVKKLEELAITQPAKTSGGQSGIQDRVFIEGPDGQRHRVIG